MNLATIAIVGENMKHTPGIAGKLFGTLVEMVLVLLHALKVLPRQISHLLWSQNH